MGMGTCSMASVPIPVWPDANRSSLALPRGTQWPQAEVSCPAVWQARMSVPGLCGQVLAAGAAAVPEQRLAVCPAVPPDPGGPLHTATALPSFAIDLCHVLLSPPSCQWGQGASEVAAASCWGAVCPLSVLCAPLAADPSSVWAGPGRSLVPGRAAELLQRLPLHALGPRALPHGMHHGRRAASPAWIPLPVDVSSVPHHPLALSRLPRPRLTCCPPACALSLQAAGIPGRTALPGVLGLPGLPLPV